MPLKISPNICPICKKGKEFGFIMDFLKEKYCYSLFQCSECGVQFWEPRKNPGEAWYQDRNPYEIINLVGHKVYRGYHKKFIERSKKLPKGLKILDIGCGAGEFIAELEKLGFEVFGIDFDKKAVQIAKNNFGLKNIFPESLDEFLERKDFEKFDIITFFEVLEHMDNPVTFIENLQKALKPDGKIIFSVPSRERFLVNSNKWDFPPHHFTRWEKKSIENIFSKHGFGIDFIDYVEVFKIIMGAIDGKFRSGLVQKTLNSGNFNKKRVLFSKILYFLGKIKQWILAVLPAVFLWFFGKITKKNNGIIYVEMTIK
jgi:SAM-dependent methyltransferase